MLIHSRSTLKSYAKHLGITDLREGTNPTGSLSHRSLAWRIAEGTRNFWKVVRARWVA
jgi:hypothetical protein